MAHSSNDKPDVYRFADLEIDTGRHRVRRGARDISLPTISYRFLLALVHAAPNMVSYDELVDEVWSGRDVSPETIAQRIKLLRAALDDQAGHPRYIRVIRGEGFQMIPEVRWVADNFGGAPVKLQQRVLIGGTISGIIVTAFIAWMFYSPDTPERDLPSIAVLPFENLSPNPDDAYFAAGIHEEVLNQLAKLRGLRVISRTSVLNPDYTNGEMSIREIANELNVASMMEGSVRFADDRVRIVVQLIDAATDEHVLGQVYERHFSDIFAIQSDIAMNITDALEAELSLQERAAIEKKATESPEAYAFYLRAIVDPNSNSLAVRELPGSRPGVRP